MIRIYTLIIFLLFVRSVPARVITETSPDSLYTAFDLGGCESYEQQLDSLVTRHSSLIKFEDSYNYVRAVTLLANYHIQRAKLTEAQEIIIRCEKMFDKQTLNSDYLFYLLYPKACISYLLDDTNRAYDYIIQYKQELEARNLIGIEYAECLECIALIENLQGNMVNSKIYLDVAIDIYNTKIGDIKTTNRKSCISLLMDLSLLYYNKQNYSKARDILETAYNISVSSGFDDMSNSITTSLITIYQKLQDYNAALALINKSGNVEYNQLMLLTQLTNTAHVYLDAGKQTEFEYYSNTACEIIKEEIREKVNNFTTVEHENFWYKYAPMLMLESNVGLSLNCSNQYLCNAYDTALFLHDIENFSDVRLKRISLNVQRDNNIEKIQRIDSIKQCMMYSSINWTEWKALRDSIYLLERELINSIEANNQSNMFKSSTWIDVKNLLKNNEAAIEFIKVPIIKDLELCGQKYGALIITPKCDKPMFVDLCNIEEIDSVVNNKDPYSINYLYQSPVIYNYLWSKIEPSIKEYNNLYVSFTGNLSAINHNLILDNNSKELSTKYNVYSVPSTSMIEFCKRKYVNIENAVVFGGMIYDFEKSESYTNENSDDSSYHQQLVRAGFQYLPGTKDEAELVANVLCNNNISVTTHIGINATEENFKRLNGVSPDIIHIATHCYNLSYEGNDSIYDSIIGMTNEEHLMARTGLLMTNSLRFFEKNNYNEDGVLTADEISRLDLSKTKVAILSACETGIGYDDLSGMIGLQRGLLKAGVKNLILSLWKIPDDVTKNLMENFYNKLCSGVELHDALLEAQKDMKREYKDPYYWASFIIVN